MMEIDVTNLFFFVDEFKKQKDLEAREEKEKEAGRGNFLEKKKTRTARLEISEITTIVLWYNFSGYKTFKDFYLRNGIGIKEYFPKAPSYNRFIELKFRTGQLLHDILEWFLAEAEDTGISFIDSTRIEVCTIKRIFTHKVFKGAAAKGKSSYGWFFGFKLHLIINDKGQIVSLCFSKGNMHDMGALSHLTTDLTGLLFGDKGYIGQEAFEELFSRGLKKVTPQRKNMKKTLIPLLESLLLGKRSLVETVIGILKRTFELEHSRHRSNANAVIHWFSVLVSYCLRPSKPTMASVF